MTRPESLLRRFIRDENGTAVVEFVLVMPFLLFFFLAGVESGFAMLKQSLLDRAVDIVMRDLRIGNIQNATNEVLRNRICAQPTMLTNCDDQLAIEILAIDRTSWAMPTGPVPCVDRVANINPVTTLTIGQQNAVMLVRVCAIQDALFPFTGVGAAMKVDNTGYAVVAISTFVNEP